MAEGATSPDQFLGPAGNAKSYAERLFDYQEVGPLPLTAAEDAIVKPAKDEGVDFEPGAETDILAQTRCYPYFLQEWGKHAWDIATASLITSADVSNASSVAIANLDESFFRVRFDSLTPAEKKYLRAMAELGPGPHRSGDIADKLRLQVSSQAPVRGALIA